MLKQFPLVLLLFLSATAASAGNNSEMDARLDRLMGTNTHQQYHDFLTKLQRLVKEKDKEAVASLVDYPLTVTVAQKEISIADRGDFIKHYDKIFNDRLVTILSGQKYADLFAKDTGVMIGPHGELWYGGICTVSDCSQFVIKIMQINN